MQLCIQQSFICCNSELTFFIFDFIGTTFIIQDSKFLTWYFSFELTSQNSDGGPFNRMKNNIYLNSERIKYSQESMQKALPL